MGFLEHPRAQQVATAINLAQAATASKTLLAAQAGASPSFRPFVEWFRLKGGTAASMVLKIGSRTVGTAAAGAVATSNGPVVGKAGEAITIEHVGATAVGEYELTFGFLVEDGDAATE